MNINKIGTKWKNLRKYNILGDKNKNVQIKLHFCKCILSTSKTRAKYIRKPILWQFKTRLLNQEIFLCTFNKLQIYPCLSNNETALVNLKIQIENIKYYIDIASWNKIEKSPGKKSTSPSNLFFYEMAAQWGRGG